MINVSRKLGAALVGAAVGAALFAAPASAHVSVNPNEAAQGGFAKLTFRVPNEKDSGSTTKVEVAFPEDAPLGFVSTKPVAGWTAVATKSKLAKPIKTDDGEVTEAVTRVVWTATSADTGIKPGEFQEFDVSVGPLPTDKDKMVFKSLQTYSDGEVVRWIDEKTGSEEPEHPAPVLTLTKPAKAEDHHGSSSTAGDADEKHSASEHGESDGGLPLGLAIAGLVAGLGGLALGGIAFARGRRTSA